MSIRRPKRPTHRNPDAAPFGERPAEQPTKMPKWKDAVAGQPDEAFAPYAPTESYAVNAFVLHGKFGKGMVVGVEPGKVAILFEDGPKKLVHAVKPAGT